MKPNTFSRIAAAVGVLAAAASAWAAPLTETTAVHTQPNASAPTITFLKAGTEPVADATAMATTPNGWMAVELPGPFEGYVENKDLTKALDVKPGSAIRLAPKADAGVLTKAEKGDKTKITGLHGKWTQVSLEKKLIGYINVGSQAALPAAVPAPVPPPPAPIAQAPVPATAYGVGGPGQAAPMVNLGDSANSLPRQFAGRFVYTQSAFHPKRPYDYALNDDAGKRYAYLDVSKLLQTERIESYVDHKVVVFGAARPTADGKDIVIQVETLQLK